MDYFKILNLQREPFSNSPEPDFFFQSDQHLACLQKLELAVRLRRGLNVVIGEVGTGKTTLCRRLIMNLSSEKTDREQIETHLILDPSFSNAREFLDAVAIFFDLPISSTGASEWQIKENIKNYLFNRGVDEGRTVVLIIDEGQKLPEFCLEILREFLNFETNEFKLLQIIIFAQREFEESLLIKKNFADRVNQYYFLKPLNFKNTVKMIKYRIFKAADGASSPPRLFSLPALWAIYRGTGGYPRKIITLCHQVLLATIIQNRVKAGYRLVKSCAERASFTEATRRTSWVYALLLSVLFVVPALLYFTKPEFFLWLQGGTAGKQSTSAIADVPPGRENPPLPIPPGNNELPAEPSVVPDSITEAPPAPVATESIKAKSASLPLSAEPSQKVLHKMPDILGQLTVKKNDYLLALLTRLYGDTAKDRLDQVARVNPHIRNINLVKQGDVIRIPARRNHKNPLPAGNCWVRIASVDTLSAAYDLVREHSKSAPLFVVPVWDERQGLRFSILLKEGFDTKEAAEQAIRSLSPDLTADATIVNKWSDDTVFL